MNNGLSMQPSRPIELGFQRLAALSSDERGAAMIEYALISALVALAIVASIGELGRAHANTFNGVTDFLGPGGNGHGKGGGNSGNGKGNGGPVGR